MVLYGDIRVGPNICFPRTLEPGTRTEVGRLGNTTGTEGFEDNVR